MIWGKPVVFHWFPFPPKRGKPSFRPVVGQWHNFIMGHIGPMFTSWVNFHFEKKIPSGSGINYCNIQYLAGRCFMIFLISAIQNWVDFPASFVSWSRNVPSESGGAMRLRHAASHGTTEGKVILLNKRSLQAQSQVVKMTSAYQKKDKKRHKSGKVPRNKQ